MYIYNCILHRGKYQWDRGYWSIYVPYYILSHLKEYSTMSMFWHVTLHYLHRWQSYIWGEKDTHLLQSSFGAREIQQCYRLQISGKIYTCVDKTRIGMLDTMHIWYGNTSLATVVPGARLPWECMCGACGVSRYVPAKVGSANWAKIYFLLTEAF